MQVDVLRRARFACLLLLANTAREGNSRAVTQFLGHIARGEPIRLVDGGARRRTFTCIDDGVDALMRIIENEGGMASGKIYNVGNPLNIHSVRELATMMVALALTYPEFRGHCPPRGHGRRFPG